MSQFSALAGFRSGLSPPESGFWFRRDHVGQPVGVARLADELQVTRLTVSDSVQVAGGRGLLLRRADPLDGRSHALAPDRHGASASPAREPFALRSPRCRWRSGRPCFWPSDAFAGGASRAARYRCSVCAGPVPTTGETGIEASLPIAGEGPGIAELRTDCAEHKGEAA